MIRTFTYFYNDYVADSVSNYALEVWKPNSYTGPQDQSQLGTIWLAYIPSKQVDNLAQQLKASDSTFYTGLGTPYSTLAAHVDSSFGVDTVSPGDSDNSGSGGGQGNGSTSDSDNTGSSSSSSKTREDAIIGVVASLGAIALIVLAFLIARAVKQRRELAHRRLSDAMPVPGARPDGQEFDRDSLGGQRRRSFYYAADSLRGFEDQGQTEAYDANMSPEGMRERRPVMPGMISTPVLRDNTMNW